MSKHKVGDICITVNTSYPAINNGVLVVIIGIDCTFTSYKGEPAPYLIRRVDGQVLGSTTCTASGEHGWGKHYEAHCAGYKLKRIDDQAFTDPVTANSAVAA